ncbi:AAR064Wp [Eremothecium gossypii ATCC 10895]|uniref:Mitochondrial inner membrane protease ATP23 n=1 Tax=Eremothecium gossypii (strain ATCC 10895 / CBS 109.51 / FGSC 9923 / NRRL Y-1056) TaxID=284811 RepID=ATP23_EREGS|nr:AAR064Wp [Eremothecium gossypii ATCC 10895]Q75EL5.1 RecName: Full=Mitochondrial inner membrane protease ATP23 [Eremothecium gossypii ATCC 10895]AAS50429.1 AAR064Wp [Eremothecium gossypii ATCC 10895]AEY94715.1 FAAR064Wp [Eremothecium gossypii FDAG1]
MSKEPNFPPSEKLEKVEAPADLRSIAGFEWWRRTFEYKTGLGLTPEAKVQYEKDYQYVLQREQCKQCYDNRDWLLKYSPTVVFMTQQIAKLNRRRTGDDSLHFDTSKIICDVCPEWKSGGFNPSLGILLCQNRIRDKWQMEDTLSHELVHQFDELKFEVDWMNLKHHACSEVRASNLSGECRLSQEFFRRGFNGSFGRGHQECVRRRAVLSVMGNPKCKDKAEAEQIVDEVWQSCFNDTRPFEEIYR